MSIKSFDREISELINTGKVNQAVQTAQEHLIHSALVLSGICFDRLNQEWRAIDVVKNLLELYPDERLYSNLIFLYNHLGKFDYAKAVGEKAIEVTPTADIYYNYGLALRNLKDLEGAAEAFRNSIRLNPDFAMAHNQLSNVLYGLGQFPEALKEEQWRFKALNKFKRFRDRYSGADYNAETKISGKTILVFNEHGFGDFVQFSYYLPTLKDHSGARIIVEVKPELYSLFKNSNLADEFFVFEEDGNNIPGHDFAVSVMSLPFFFDLSFEFTPFQTPYLSPSEESIPEEALRLMSGFDDKIKIGINWAGMVWNARDRMRSCPLRFFRPLFENPKIQVFGIQKGEMVRTWGKGRSTIWHGDDEIDVVDLLEGAEGLKFIDLGPHLNDFNDTVHVIKNLDLVVTVDSSVIHLAGAIGKKAYLLLSYAYEWRWLRNWYPTIKVFRQPNPGDWEKLLIKIASEIID